MLEILCKIKQLFKLNVCLISILTYNVRVQLKFKNRIIRFNAKAL